jgi:hypothetical protein
MFSHLFCILSADFTPGLKIRRINPDNHPGNEPIDKLLRELANHFGVRIRGHYDLLSRQVYSIKGVQEFLLRRGLARQEVNVVDSQQIRLPNTTSESLQLSCLQGEDKLIGKILR